MDAPEKLCCMHKICYFTKNGNCHAYFPGNFMKIFSSVFSEYLQTSASGNGIEPVNPLEIEQRGTKFAYSFLLTANKI